MLRLINKTVRNKVVIKFKAKNLGPELVKWNLFIGRQSKQVGQHNTIMTS